ncbi:restriction endonuclease type II-like protein (plasmid) [Rhizobium gallicum bv. gallicum R602sp]|uniref:Restriction endonuclease type II-like protein n=2 Tax=Rhizobium gallicum TaxID=56730 RepID=A0A0B4X681_9HYPH|nr:restriction endonuclease type II-like protein [Rhizobium gallicum bv. gallicum R602sp]
MTGLDWKGMIMTTEGDLTTTEKGQNFEKEVAAIYEALGYKVERNVQVKGHQVDLLVTRSLAGARTITYMIDAKNRSSGSVGINDFASFSTTATRLFLDGAITGAIMVTNADFSQIASGQALDSNNLRLMTINELRNEIFNPSEALTRTIIDYEAREINAEYIALDAESNLAHVIG